MVILDSTPLTGHIRLDAIPCTDSTQHNSLDRLNSTWLTGGIEGIELEEILVVGRVRGSSGRHGSGGSMGIIVFFKTKLILRFEKFDRFCSFFRQLKASITLTTFC